MKLVKEINKTNIENEISDKEAEEAFVKILKYIGEDPGREGLLETPKRVRKAFKEYFKGYHEDPYKILSKTFGDVDGYNDIVIQKNISVQSHCEHHMAPIIGIAHVAYIPNERVVGLSKLARVVEAFSKIFFGSSVYPLKYSLKALTSLFGVDCRPSLFGSSPIY